jgi:hypothetical protein
MHLSSRLQAFIQPSICQLLGSNLFSQIATHLFLHATGSLAGEKRKSKNKIAMAIPAGKARKRDK